MSTDNVAVLFMPLKINQKHTLSHKLRPFLKIKAAAVLELRENEYAALVRRIESDPIFEKMVSEFGILKVNRFAEAHLSSRFCGLIENINAESCPPEIDSVIEQNKKTAALIQKLGLMRFEEHFLKNENALDYEVIGKECGITVNQAEKISELINSLGVYSEFYFPSGLRLNTGKYCCKIAEIEKQDDSCQIHFFAPHYVRGKYLVDYSGLNALKSNGLLSRMELDRLNTLVADIEAVNKKKTTIYEIIKYILIKQERYFATQDVRDMAFCTQKEAAKELGIEESSISRILDSRSIGMPDGSEKPLGYFFQSRREVASRLVSEMDHSMTDMEIMKILNDVHNIKVSRRTVNLYRKSKAAR